MKWVTWLLLATGVASAGCLNLSNVKEQVQPKATAQAKKAPAPPPAPPPVVLPDKVNEKNLAQTLPAFQAELDHAANEPPLQPDASTVVSRHP